MSNQSQNTQNLPTTPNWSKAPKWANYFAIDGKGVGYWHEKKPFRMGESWHNFATVAKAGLFNSIDWERSFQRRPKIETYSGQPTIDWTKAPEWANYFTIDMDRMAFWHENKPDLGFNFWNSNGQKASVGFVKGIYDWKESLQQRPKIETLTVQLNTDISGYLAGKNSFITGLVDLLLARMAKEERFGLESNSLSIAKQFDIYKVKQKTTINDWGIRYFIVFSIASLDDDHRITGIEITEKGEQFWGHLWDMDLKSSVIAYCRLITELEAVEFRTAMEAVYG